MTPLRTLLPILLLSACGGGDGGGTTTPGVVLAASAVQGSGQTGSVTEPLPLPLQVLVTGDGLPLAGRTVTFNPSAGSGIVTPRDAITGADGIASGIWTLGTSSGARSVGAIVSGLGGPPLPFTATASPGPAATFQVTAGQGQIQQVAAAFLSALEVRLRDQFGNGISGAAVAWAVESGDVTLSVPTSNTASDGRASTGVTAGNTTGNVVVRATTTSLPDTLRFQLSITPVPTVVTVASNFFSPAQITIAAGGAVKWSWNSGTHDVTYVSGPVDFGASPAQGSGATFGPVVFGTAGVYSYQCTIHPGMTGTITVQ